MYCVEYDCPYFNHENGPFNVPTDEEIEVIAKKFECNKTRIRICSSTTPDGIIHDKEALREQEKFDKESWSKMEEHYDSTRT